MFYSSFCYSRNFTLTKLSRRLFTTLQQQQERKLQQQSLRKCSKKVKEVEIFNTPRAPKDPPDDYNPTSFEHKAFEAPDFLPCSIFRQFSSPNEKLGPNAAKDATYKNPEYYAYHRFSFNEMQRQILEIRRQRICNDNAKCIYDYDSDDEADKKKVDDDSCEVTDVKKKAAGDGAKGKSGGNKNEIKSKADKAPPSTTTKK